MEDRTTPLDAETKVPFYPILAKDIVRHVGSALDDAFVFKFLQALAQHAVGDVRDGVSKNRIPATRPKQQENDGARPAAADQLDGPVKPAAQGQVVSGGHLHLPHQPEDSRWLPTAQVTI